MAQTNNGLRLKWLGIDTQQELVVFIHRHCHVCRSEGFQSLTRVLVQKSDKSIIATLNVVDSDILKPGEVGLSQSAWKKFNPDEGDSISIHHFPPLSSLSHVRSKIFGNSLSQTAFNEVINDIASEKYSNVFIAAFITACSGKLNTDEICNLTRAMIDSGHSMIWPQAIVADKHSIGGLPGNRTTMILVPIIASLGITIPKSSSRAITSPSGTADTMEVLTRVELTASEIHKVVEKEQGCIVSGSLARISPADDIIIRVEKALDLDSEEQMIASIISKKAAAGATHCIIDIPAGYSVKLRSEESAVKFKQKLEQVAAFVGLNVKAAITDGSQPVGNGIGPGLEARDVLNVLQNKTMASQRLREKSLLLTGLLYDLIHDSKPGTGYLLAQNELESGRAFKKFIAICEAQGSFNEPKLAGHRHVVCAEQRGRLTGIQNRFLSRIAKLAGAPGDKMAGVDLLVSLNQLVEPGQPVFEIHAESRGELNYALDFYNNHADNVLKFDND